MTPEQYEKYHKDESKDQKWFFWKIKTQSAFCQQYFIDAIQYFYLLIFIK